MNELLAGVPDPRNDMTNRPTRRAKARAHVQGPLGGAGCRGELALVDLRPAAQVPEAERCQRMGCVTAWPKHHDPITPEVYAEFFPERDDNGRPIPGDESPCRDWIVGAPP